MLNTHFIELELEIGLVDEKNVDNEINRNILYARQKLETLFKKMINNQVILNESLNSKGDIKNKDHEKKFSGLIEETCKLDKGIKSVLLCTKDTYEKNVEKDLVVEDVDQLKKYVNNLINTTFIYHNHLLKSPNVIFIIIFRSIFIIS